MKAKIDVGWYAFANGKFSLDYTAYSDLIGVVAWVNPDENVPKGMQGLIVTLKQAYFYWCNIYTRFWATLKDDGVLNTYQMFVAQERFNAFVPAVEWCNNYPLKGVYEGKGFIPSQTQLENIVSNSKVVNEAIEKVGGDKLQNWLMSSTEASETEVWICYSAFVLSDTCNKRQKSFVRCVVAF